MDFNLLEMLLTAVGLFIVYVLKKTDSKIDQTAADLALHRYEVASSYSVIKADALRDFATKLEIREVEKRLATANKEVQIKLDKLIDRLIDNP
jgi:hypothetical protein